jgi:hypothetical protein
MAGACKQRAAAESAAADASEQAGRTSSGRRFGMQIRCVFEQREHGETPSSRTGVSQQPQYRRSGESAQSSAQTE